MSRRTVLIAAAAVAVAVAAVGLPLFQPWRLFTDTVVDESLPGTDDPVVITPSSTTPPTVSGGPRKPATTTLARGTFVSHEHETRGTVQVIRLEDGKRVLRLEGLDTSDGPDLKVWLTDAEVREGRAGWHVFDDGKHLTLGDLKGNKGNQNYPIPDEVRLDQYRSVSIWCDRFNVSFGAAELKGS